MAKLFRNYGIALSAALSLAGCQTLPGNWSNETDKKISDSLRNDQAKLKPTELPAAVRNALLPEIKLDTKPDLLKGQNRFDVVVKRSPAKDVFLSLVSGTPYSVLVDPDIKGTLTLQLKNVTIDEAFAAIHDAYGYTYTREQNRYVVHGKGLKNRIFRVNYLNLVRNGLSSTRITAGELTGGASGGSTDSSSAGSGGGGKSSVGVDTSYSHDFWKALKESLDTLIGHENGRKVVVNAETGMVIVRASPDELSLIEQFLSTTQQATAQQVILEAKILEVELNDGFQAGINWANLLKTGVFDVTAAQIGGGKILTGAGVSEITGETTSNLISSSIKNAQTSAFGGIFSLALGGNGNFGAFLEMIQTQGDVHVLSSPRVSTVNGQKAVIKIGGEEFYITNISSTASTTSGTSGTGNVSQAVHLTPFFSGISLDVTPQIDETESITLHLHSTVSEVSQRNKNFIISGTDYNLPLAASSIRESDNIVRAKTGQIIVVGGLMKETTMDEEARVPILGSLPIVGNLFRQKKVSRVKKELVMLVKPTVVDNNQTWAGDVGGSIERFDSLKR